MAPRVLIVDDDLDSREALGLVFSSHGGTCELVPSGVEALEVLARATFDAVICDVRMEGMDGLELLDRVKRSRPSLPVILISGAAEVRDAVDAIKRGAFEYMVKPLDADALQATVAGALDRQHRRATTEDSSPPSAAATAGMGELIGPGAPMSVLRATIEQVAASSAPVLITGETGVGKELVARAIHAHSNRRSYPFIAMNTSAIQDGLFESELFGHVRGAFTGAVQSRKGLLTEADHGTLLLDEIGDMPMGLQSKLLRVLQFGEVRPVGSDRVHSVDVRILAATHRDLPALIREGRFREDLYFRLNVLPIQVPPLRERRSDIPALAAHFLAASRVRAPGSPVRSIGEEGLRALTEAPWPGNVRELASAIERAVVFSGDETVGPQHFLALSNGHAAAPISWPPDSLNLPCTMRRMSAAYVQWVFAQSGGDKRRAADILGINLSTLYRWQRALRDPSRGRAAVPPDRASDG